MAYKKYNQPMRATFPVTVHLLFFRGDRVLLLRRFNTGYADGQYSVPAGHLDGGETVIAAARREGLEETGVRIEAEDVHFSSVVHRKDGDERVDFFVHVRGWQGEPAGPSQRRIEALVFSPSAVCASSQITSWYASRESDAWWRANHAYVWIVSGLPPRSGSLPRSIGGDSRSPYPSVVRSRWNWETSRRRWVRMRMPSVRAASTKPAAAIVLPDAVGWRKR